MIAKVCKFDEVKDIQPVDQYGFVDLVECMSKGEVPSTISDTEAAYNEIDDPSTIYGKPRDSFEAIRMSDYIKSVGKTEE